MSKAIGFIIFLVVSCSGFDQTTENKAWYFLSHTGSFKKMQCFADAQVRSSNKVKRIETLLLRTGLSYNINEAHSVAFGYARKGVGKKDFQSYNTPLNTGYISNISIVKT